MGSLQTAGREPAPEKGGPHGGRQGGAGTPVALRGDSRGNAVLRAQAWHPGSQGRGGHATREAGRGRSRMLSEKHVTVSRAKPQNQLKKGERENKEDPLMLLTANDKDGGGLAGRSWHCPWPYTVPLATAGGQESPWTAVPTSVLQRGVSGHTHTHPCRPGRWQRTCRGPPSPRARARATPGAPAPDLRAGASPAHTGKPLPRSR